MKKSRASWNQPDYFKHFGYQRDQSTRSFRDHYNLGLPIPLLNQVRRIIGADIIIIKLDYFHVFYRLHQVDIRPKCCDVCTSDSLIKIIATSNIRWNIENFSPKIASTVAGICCISGWLAEIIFDWMFVCLQSTGYLIYRPYQSTISHHSLHVDHRTKNSYHFNIKKIVFHFPPNFPFHFQHRLRLKRWKITSKNICEIKIK